MSLANDLEKIAKMKLGPVISKSTPNLKWKRTQRHYSTARMAMLGRWTVGHVQFDSFAPRDSAKEYRASCALPGVRNDLGRHETEEQAIHKVESVVERWLRGMNDRPPDDESVR